MDFDLTKKTMSRLLSLKKKNANGVIELPKGNYEIEAHSPGEFVRKDVRSLLWRV